MPAHAFMYGLPYELYDEHAIRRYGFHGTSHSYLTQEAAKMLGKPVGEINLITCHLGGFRVSGTSASAPALSPWQDQTLWSLSSI